MNHNLDETRTQGPDLPMDSFDPALEAGLAAAFGPDTTPGGWSQPPLLRDDPSAYSPVVHPGSPEMPRCEGEPYQFLGEIARGGMGVILKGRDPDLGRDLAVKVLRAEFVGKPSAVQRFVEEAQVGGQLQHPGIVPVYDLGRFADGRPYFAMKLVKGHTLAELLAERQDPSTDRGRFLRYFLQVCQTIAYAHSRGVIHRDLKPSNVMVGDFGVVLVMDWGLAKVLTRGGIADEEKADQASQAFTILDEPTEIRTARFGSGSETAAGSVMGTPAFMPPEQAGGEIDKLDERADVFGLGAILCVVLTGKPPYLADTSEGVRLMAVRGQLEEAFTRLNGCGADAELIGLCKRCLSADRDGRPRHAEEVAGAVSAYLVGVEDRARKAELDRATAAAEVKEQRKRRRAQGALGLTFTALVMLGGAFAWWQDKQAIDRQAERDRNDREQLAAQARATAERETRQGRTAASVSAALSDARTRGEEAWTRADEPSRMRTATDLALAAVRRAEGFVTAGEPTPEVIAELGEVRTAVADLDRHARLFVTAEQILQDHGMLGNYDHQLTVQRMYGAFKEFGWAADQFQPEMVADAVVCSRVRNQLLGYLGEMAWQGDRWAHSVLQVSRRRAGGVLTVWQNLRDRNDVPGLVAFAASPDALELGPEQICQLGQDLATARQHAPRLGLLRRSVERYPMHVWSRYDLMLTCQAQSPPLSSEALQHAAALTALRPDSARFQCDLGQCLNSVGARDPAEAALRRAIALGPKYAQSYIALGANLRNTGDLKGAMDCFKELIHQVPQNQWGHANVGYILYIKKDYEGAAACYAEAVRIDPKNAKFRSEFGMILLAKKDLNGAVEQYLEAIRFDPRNGAHQDGLGRALQAQGDVNGAFVHFQQAMRLNPNDLFIRSNFNQALDRRVNALLDKRDVNGAIATLREALRFDPNNADYHNKVAWFLATGPDQPGNGKQAVTSAATACALTNWKDPLLIDTLAAAHAAAGDFDKAVEYQKKALSMPTLDKKFVPGAQDRMLLYSQKQPYRDPGLAPREVAPPPREVKQ